MAAKKKKGGKHLSIESIRKAKRSRIVTVISVLIILMIAAAVFYFLRIDTSYNGLGDSQIPEMNTYMSSGFSEKKVKGEKTRLRFYKDHSHRSLAGIDVSVHQKDINWGKVRKAGIDFAMIRVGYRTTDSGRILSDSKFEKNVKGSSKAGLKTGVYFFSQARNRKEAIEEAKFVIRKLRGHEIDYPVAFDMEDTRDNDRHEGLTRNERTEIADAFLTVIKNNGYTPLLYGNPSWLLKKVDITKLTHYSTWLAHYSERSAYPFKYSIWQYSNTGRIPGISTKVDLNIAILNK